MKRIKEGETRLRAEHIFDDCIEDFFDLSSRFVDDIKRVWDSDESIIKIYTLGLTYFEDIKLIAENTLVYSSYIRNHILSIREQKHEKIKKRIDSDLLELRGIVSKIASAGSTGIKNIQSTNNSLIVLEGSSTALRSSINSKFMEDGYMVYEDIQKMIETIEGEIIGLLDLPNKRDDAEYERLYDMICDDYYSSDEWQTLSNNYIDTLYKRKFKHQEVSLSELERIEYSLYDKLVSQEEIGTIWESTEDNKTLRAKRISELQLPNSHLINLQLSYEGKIDIITDWMKELIFKEECFEPYNRDINTTEVVFVTEYTKRQFERNWQEIREYMKQQNLPAYAWCCLHHTMTFYNKIEKTEFAFFMRWLNEYSGEELISEANIRQYKNNYFVKTVKEKWNLDALLKEKNTAQIQTSYQKYCEICLELKDILGK